METDEVKEKSSGLSRPTTTVDKKSQSYATERQKANARKTRYLANLTEEQKALKREKDREYYRRRMERSGRKKIVEMSDPEKNLIRKKWRENSKKYRERKNIVVENKESSEMPIKTHKRRSITEMSEEEKNRQRLIWRGCAKTYREKHNKSVTDKQEPDKIQHETLNKECENNTNLPAEKCYELPLITIHIKCENPTEEILDPQISEQKVTPETLIAKVSESGETDVTVEYHERVLIKSEEDNALQCSSTAEDRKMLKAKARERGESSSTAMTEHNEVEVEIEIKPEISHDPLSLDQVQVKIEPDETDGEEPSENIVEIPIKNEFDETILFEDNDVAIEIKKEV